MFVLASHLLDAFSLFIAPLPPVPAAVAVAAVSPFQAKEITNEIIADINQLTRRVPRAIKSADEAINNFVRGSLNYVIA